MTYAEAIAWLFSTQMFGIKLGLDGPRRLLKEFRAYPQHGVTVIHVAGTNGKGSTCAMMDAIARACGKRCGLFTSPHLIDFRERIQVGGRKIPEADCAAALTELRALCARLDPHPTFFEISLALAMRWFAQSACELIFLETGMGGRLDATTAVPADVCVFAPIDLDHTEWLGNSLAQIAAEKAAILVPGKPAVSAPQPEDVRHVLEQAANEVRAPLEFVTEPLLGYGIALLGAHQPWNAALAVAALHRAGVALNFDSIQHGLTHLSWPGRFEIFPAAAGADEPVVLDGAHNTHAAEVLAATWQAAFPDQRPVLVFSAVASKDIVGILRWLAPLAAKIFFCPVANPRAVSAAELAAALPPGAPPHQEFGDLAAAFAAAIATRSPILVAGSLFLVGEARALLINARYQPSVQ
ncbi:MAG: bifunctional folylpolyglutamate synthase/dihydrofolate synthase [Verrucomicrobia bacterium]|nr:MAG: bifunctional folylpolyglutamate synthase/dihydrofolate synthase [Verrucomicrobiota bacterium]